MIDAAGFAYAFWTLIAFVVACVVVAAFVEMVGLALDESDDSAG